jgi:hypothetical protein
MKHILHQTCENDAALLNIRKCAVLEKRPPEWTRENFVGQPLKVELYEKKLEAVADARSKKTGGVCTSVEDFLSRAYGSPLLYTPDVVRV